MRGALQEPIQKKNDPRGVSDDREGGWGGGGLTSVEIKRRATPVPGATTSSPTCLKQAVSRCKDIPASPDPSGEGAALAISELIIRPPPPPYTPP